MKKLYLILIACSLFIINDLSAQITIDQSDFPVVGEVWVELSDGRYGMHPITPGGANQTWNYANVFVVDDTTVLSWIDPATTPPQWASNFPNANLSFYELQDSTAIYFRSAVDGFYVDGAHDITGSQPVMTIDLDPDLLLVPTPFTYNDTRTHVSKFSVEQPAVPPSPGLLYKETTMQSFDCDAYGTITTPAGTYPNVLRIKTFEYVMDSLFIDTLGNGTYIFLTAEGPKDTSITYRFMKKGSESSVMVISEDPAAPGTSLDAFYFNASAVGINEFNDPKSTVNVFPNPVMQSQHWITFEIMSTDAEVLNVYDMNGRLVRSEFVGGVNTFRMNTDSFKRGVYNCEISGSKMIPVRSRFVVQ